MLNILYLSTASTCSRRSCRNSVLCLTTAASPSPDTSPRQSLSASPWWTVDCRSSLNSCLVMRWSARSDSVCTTSLGNSVSWRSLHSRDSNALMRSTFSANFSIAWTHQCHDQAGLYQSIEYRRHFSNISSIVLEKNTDKVLPILFW